MSPRSIFASVGCVIALFSAFALAQDGSRAAGTVVNVEVQTSAGAFVIELDAERAPVSVGNFIKYANSGHYDGTVFHRVIEGFMIQGGGLDQSLRERKTMPPIKNEANNGLRNRKYTVAMARAPEPNSATSQFFVNMNDNHFLDRDKSPDGFGYAVFGRVIQGEAVAEKIAGTKTGVIADPVHEGAKLEDVPEAPIVIRQIRVMK